MNLNSDASSSASGKLPSEVADLDPASAALGVRFVHCLDSSLVYRQQVAPWQTDRSGRPSLATIGVLVDDALGSAAYVFGGDHSMNYVVSHLSVALTGPVPSGELRATGRLDSGENRSRTLLATGMVEGDDGPFAVARCRSVEVTPPPGFIARNGPGEHPADVSAVTFDRALRIEVDGDSAGRLSGTWSPAEWMINPFGTVQGGILFSVAASFAELTADSLCTAEQDHLVGEFSLDLLGSPTIDQPYRVASRTVRDGRRLANIDVEIADRSGRVMAQARSTAFKFPREGRDSITNM